MSNFLYDTEVRTPYKDGLLNPDDVKPNPDNPGGTTPRNDVLMPPAPVAPADRGELFKNTSYQPNERGKFQLPNKPSMLPNPLSIIGIETQNTWVKLGTYALMAYAGYYLINKLMK